MVRLFDVRVGEGRSAAGCGECVNQTATTTFSSFVRLCDDIEPSIQFGSKPHRNLAAGQMNDLRWVIASQKLPQGGRLGCAFTRRLQTW
jgi:hypothetical protein